MDQLASGGSVTRIWLNGDRWNQAYIYDTENGRYQQFRTRSEVGATAGNGSKMSGRFVATYVAQDKHDIWLQVGDSRYPVDGTTHAEAHVRFGGLLTTLVVERPGMSRLTLQQRTPSRWLLRRADPSWDGIDELAEDSASGIASLFNSAEARETYRRVKDPGAGPWHLLEDQS